jgi:8-oxo-dGTP pyrophosphatase MutT (NUDIX family)
MLPRLPSYSGMNDVFLHPAIPAATIVLFRDGHNTARPDLLMPEILMVERSANMAFAAGALAFPGGRVDSDDHHLGFMLDYGLDYDEAAARVAAIRETLEETGIALAMGDAVSAEQRAEMRTALHAGTPFSQLLKDANQTLYLDQLVPFARWRPNFAEARIFDARFYLGCCPADQDADHIDDGENSSLFWASAADTLDRAHRGEARIIFPTRRNLERLAQFPDFASAVADARAFDAQRMITPWIEDRKGTPHLCIPDDLGYPITAEAMDKAMRG